MSYRRKAKKEGRQGRRARGHGLLVALQIEKEQRKSYFSGMKKLPSCKDELKPLMSCALTKAELFCLVSILVYSCFPDLEIVVNNVSSCEILQF